MKDTYLGDGAYARFDGYYLWVTAERDDRLHEVALEPEGLKRLVEFYQQVTGRQL